MKRFALAPLAVALAAALTLPAASLAKGASEATIEGPGLADPISLAGEGQPGGVQLMALADSLGFFPAVFEQSPDPMLDEHPDGALGARYTVTYVMPGPNGELDRLRQDVYPYAAPAPVSYMEPGQRFWGTERTRGGWFVAPSTVKSDLVAVGLPSAAPADDGGSQDGSHSTLVGGLTGGAALLGLVIVATLAVRRRPRPAATS